MTSEQQPGGADPFARDQHFSRTEHHGRAGMGLLPGDGVADSPLKARVGQTQARCWATASPISLLGGGEQYGTSVGGIERAPGYGGVVLEDQQPTLLAGSSEDPPLGFERDQGLDIVALDPG